MWGRARMNARSGAPANPARGKAQGRILRHRQSETKRRAKGPQTGAKPRSHHSHIPTIGRSFFCSYLSSLSSGSNHPDENQSGRHANETGRWARLIRDDQPPVMREQTCEGPMQNPGALPERSNEGRTTRPGQAAKDRARVAERRVREHDGA